MRRLLLILCILTCAQGFINKVKASHAAGAELTYVWVSDSTYRFFAKFYRDCSGITEPFDFVMCIRNGCSSFTTSITLTKMTTLPNGSSNGQSVSTGCPGNQTSCNGGSVIGFKEWWYSGLYTLPSRCDSWRFSISECCRNNAITNLNSPGSQDIYIEAYLNNLDFSQNSSPQFTNVPVPYVCAGQAFSYNNGTIEADGDSLVFSSIRPRDGSCGTASPINIGYTSGTYNNLNNPFNTTNTFTCDSATGTMSFTANGQQSVVTSLLCQEYRSGILVGSVMRDVQMIIRNCTSPVPQQNFLQNTLANATFDTATGFITMGCFSASTPITFCFNVTSTNASAVLVPNDNHAIAIPSSTVTYTGLGTDSVVGCFSWTPTIADTGLTLLVINIKDSTCTVGSPFIVTNSLTLPIFIGTYVGIDSVGITNVVDCTIPNTGGIIANVSSTQPSLTYSLTPGGATNTNGVFTGLPLGIYTMSVSDGQTCVRTTTVNIISPNAPNFTSASAIAATCNLNNGGINSVATAPNGGILYHFNVIGSGSPTGNYSNLAPSTYTVLAQDAFLCTGSTIITVPSIVPIAINPIASGISCGNALSNITVNTTTGASTPFQYSLNGGTFQLSNIFANVAAGNYTIVGKDSNNCTSTVPLTITAPLPLTITNVVPNNPSCVPSNNGSITFSTSGGTGAVQFSTNNVTYQSTNPFNNLTAGTYTIYVKDANNCTTSSTVTLSNPLPPTINSINSTLALCGAAVGSINAVASTSNGTLSYTLTSPPQTNGSGNFTNLLSNTYTLTATDALNCTVSSTVFIASTPSPIINSVLTTPNKCGNGNGTLVINASGGTGALEYNIGGSFVLSNSFTNLAGTSYVATVKDASNCTASSNVSIPQAPTPTISLSATPIACNNGVTTINTNLLSGNSTPFKYSLNSGAFGTTSSFTNISSGNYTVTIQDSNLCTNTATFSLSNPPLILINNVTSTVAWCTPSNNASITINASGGTPALVYSANNGSTFQPGNTVINQTAGVYTIVVRDSKLCTQSVTHTVAASPAVAVNLTNTSDFCTKNAGTVTAAITGGTANFFYSLNGSPLSSGNLFAGLGAGTYTVTAQDSRGCTSVSTTSVIATAAPSFTTVLSTPNKCNGTNGTITVLATGSAAILNYKLSSITNTTGNFINLLPGNYTITATDINNCTNTTVVSVANAPSPVINVTANAIQCGNGTTTININVISGASTPLLHSLNGGVGQTSTSFTNISSGNYTVVTTDSNACKDTATISLSNPSTVTISNAISTIPNCVPANTANITTTASGGTGSLSYSVNGSAFSTNNIATGLIAGTYTITVQDGNSCSSTSAVTVPLPASVALTSSNTTSEFCNKVNGTLTSTFIGGTPPLDYQLNGTSFGNNGGNFTNLAANTYTVIATDTRGCTSSLVTQITFVNGPTINNIATTLNTCNQSNGSITINASSPTIITSYGNGIQSNTSGIFTNLIGNTYTTTVMDANNCSTTSVATVINAPSPVITTAAPNILCNNGTTTITANLVSGNSLPMDYKLSNGAWQASNIFSNVSFGSYTITVRDTNNCTGTSSINIANPAAVVINSLAATIPTCIPGSDGVITTSASGGSGALTYLVNNGAPQSSNQFGGLAAGNYTIQVTDANGCSSMSNIQINNPVAPTLTNWTATRETCVPGNDGKINVAASGGTGALQYSSNNGASWQASSNFTGLGAGTYTMVVRDGKNCTASDVATVNPFPSISLNIDTLKNIACFGQTNGKIVASASGGTAPILFSLQGTGLSNATGAFNNLAAGTYTVNINDSANCSASSIVTIIAPPQLIINSATVVHISCNGNPTGSLTVLANGGTGNLNYTITPSNFMQVNNGNFLSLSSGTYSINISDVNNCSVSTSLTLTQPVIQNFTATAINAPTCFGGSNGSIVTGAVNGTTPYTFYLSGAITDTSTNGFFTNLTAGIYSILCVDANNCATITTLQIGQPNGIQFGTTTSTAAICKGDNSGTISTIAYGGIGGISYALSPTGQLSATGIFNGISSGVYSVTALDALGCTATKTIAVVDGTELFYNVPTIIQPLCKDISNGQIIVSGFNGTPPYKYAIANGVSSPFGAFSLNYSFSNLAPGFYKIRMQDAKGCTKDTTISLQPENIFTLSTTEVSPPLCYGENSGSITAVATGLLTTGYYYILNPGNYSSASGQFENLSSGTYTIIAKDINGCQETAIVVIGNPPNPLTINTSVQQIICSFGQITGGATANVNGGMPPYNYGWNGPGISASNSISGLSAGFYSVTVTDTAACSVTDTFTIFNAPCCDIDMPNSFTPDGDGLNDYFKPLTSATILNVSFQIYNRWGNQVFGTSLPYQGWDGTNNGKPCDMDTYYYSYKYFCNYSDKWVYKQGDIVLIR
jgi:large repetitive protein